MNLAGLFQYGNKNTGTRNTENVRAKGSVSSSQQSQARQAVRGMTPGQTIQGEIVSKNGSEVQIRIDRDVVITARLDRDIPVSVGQNMTFEIKNNTGAQVALRPLYENLAQDVNVLKALEAAKLPATEQLMRMVSSMMEQGMSIDKNALLDMSRVVTAYPHTDPASIVMLKGMQLSVTPENIEQFENYQRYEHQLLGDIKDILSELPRVYQNLIQAGDTDAAVTLYRQVLQLFAETQTVTDTETVADKQVFSDMITDGENISQGQEKEPVTAAGTVRPEGDAPATVQIKAETEMEAQLLRLAGEEENTEKMFSYQKGALIETFNAAEREQLAVLLDKIGFPGEQLPLIQKGSITAGQLLKELGMFLQENPAVTEKPELIRLFGSKEYQQLLNKEILQQWMLKPEEVADKNKVEEFYGRLKSQTARLADAVGMALKDTPLSKSLVNVQNNIDFMNQMNQVFQYIQLPLKMSMSEAHGDLYVYANKRGSEKEDGSVSALLHLDMEHLGSVDIYVRMQENHVSTKFYLQDESMLDFIAENIHILDERLEKRGYLFHAEMLLQEKEGEHKDVMKNIAVQEQKTTLLAQYSFDVRA